MDVVEDGVDLPVDVRAGEVAEGERFVLFERCFSGPETGVEEGWGEGRGGDFAIEG